MQLLCVHEESQAARHRLRIAQRRRAVDEVMTVCTQDAHDTIFRFARDVNNVRLMAIEFRSSSIANGPATERDLSLMSLLNRKYATQKEQPGTEYLGASHSKSWEYPFALLREYGGAKIMKMTIFFFSKFLHLPFLFLPKSYHRFPRIQQNPE